MKYKDKDGHLVECLELTRPRQRDDSVPIENLNFCRRSHMHIDLCHASRSVYDVVLSSGRLTLLREPNYLRYGFKVGATLQDRHSKRICKILSIKVANEDNPSARTLVQLDDDDSPWRVSKLVKCWNVIAPPPLPVEAEEEEERGNKMEVMEMTRGKDDYLVEHVKFFQNDSTSLKDLCLPPEQTTCAMACIRVGTTIQNRGSKRICKVLSIKTVDEGKNTQRTLIQLDDKRHPWLEKDLVPHWKVIQLVPTA